MRELTQEEEVVCRALETEENLRVTGSMATMPGREHACELALLSLRRQVDHLVLAHTTAGWSPGACARRLANHVVDLSSASVPGIAALRMEEDGSVVRVPTGFPMGDWAKMHSSCHPYDAKAQVVLRLTLDDDLIYPEDYVAVHRRAWLERIRRYGMAGARAFLSVHATRFLDLETMEYRDEKRWAQRNPALSVKALRPMQAHVVGTGVMSVLDAHPWRSEDADVLIGIRGREGDRIWTLHGCAYGTEENVADLHIAAFAQKHRIPLQGIATPKGGWIKTSLRPRAATIWNAGKDPASPQRARERAVMARALEFAGGKWQTFEVYQDAEDV